MQIFCRAKIFKNSFQKHENNNFPLSSDYSKDGKNGK